MKKTEKSEWLARNLGSFHKMRLRFVNVSLETFTLHKEGHINEENLYRLLWIVITPFVISRA